LTPLAGNATDPRVTETEATVIDVMSL